MKYSFPPNNYRKFSQYIKSNNRYYLDQESIDFLNFLIETSEKRSELFTRDKYLWRSQIGCSYRPENITKNEVIDIEVPLPNKRMKPISGESKEGRVNPKGITYLYLSTDKETAMSELRPWKGAYITVGQFELKRDIKIIDFSQDNEGILSIIINNEINKISDDLISSIIWSNINRAFSAPVNPSDRSADYAPTQIIAEHFKNNNFDGLAYKSSLAEGYNLCLFDMELANQVNSFIYKVDKINYSFTQAGPAYFNKK